MNISFSKTYLVLSIDRTILSYEVIIYNLVTILWLIILVRDYWNHWLTFYTFHKLQHFRKLTLHVCCKYNIILKQVMVLKFICFVGRTFFYIKSKWYCIYRIVRNVSGIDFNESHSVCKSCATKRYFKNSIFTMTQVFTARYKSHTFFCGHWKNEWFFTLYLLWEYSITFAWRK